jgi:hypothetical protein
VVGGPGGQEGAGGVGGVGRFDVAVDEPVGVLGGEVEGLPEAGAVVGGLGEGGQERAGLSGSGLEIEDGARGKGAGEEGFGAEVELEVAEGPVGVAGGGEGEENLAGVGGEVERGGKKGAEMEEAFFQKDLAEGGGGGGGGGGLLPMGEGVETKRIAVEIEDDGSGKES